MNAMTPILGIIAALTVCVVIGWAGSDNGLLVAGWPVFALCGVLAMAVQWVVFTHAWVAKTEAFFDLTGSLTYIGMVLLATWLSGATDIRSLLICGLILVWALRLGPFLYFRIQKAGEDRRFRKLKHSFPMFFMTWTLQGTWVYITASCALAALTASTKVGVDGFLIAGLALWLAGFAIEVVADNQKSAFRADPINEGQFIRTGLWAWSRHPNYFGEILLWCGIALMAWPVLSGWQLATLISPLFVVVLLTRISGVNLLERRADKEWGADQAYQEYKQNTPVLVLRPPK